MTQTILQGKKSILILGTALSVWSLGSAFAEEKPQDEIQLKEIVVTAGRTPIEEGKTGRAVTVITDKQLQQYQVRYLADALRLVPGFSVSRSGSKGGMTNIRVRGAESNHLLVMMDGVEVNAASGDAYDFGGLQVEDIERIEILRGPQSAFWGSNALAGVVNVITKGGKRDGFKISGMTETGSQNYWLGSVLLQGGGENYDMGLAASYRRSSGFNISGIGDEIDGDENLTLNGKVKVDLSETAKLDATLRYVKNRADLDNISLPDPQSQLNLYSRTTDLLGSVGLTWTALDEALTQKLRFTGNDRKYHYFAPTYPSENKGQRYTASYQATYAFDTPSFADAQHKITGGLEWKQERFHQVPLTFPVYDESQFEKHKRSMYSFVGEYNGEFADQFYVNFGLRHDVNKDFDDATTFSLSGAWAIPDTNARLHSSYGTGITNPTFYEQFGFIPSGFIGNPSLKPEKSHGWDIGVEYGFFDGRLITDVTYFNQDLRDEIITDYEVFPNTVYNLDGRSKRHGVELSASLNLFNGLSAGATYTYTSTHNPEGERAVRRPRHTGSVNATYTFYEERAQVFGEAIFNGEMKDIGDITLGQYTIVNIGGSYKFTDKLEGYARIENLFDKKYQEVYGYNTPGRGVFAGLKASF